MKTKISERGRLGNQIFRNVAVSLIAEKFNLAVDYFNSELIETLGISLFNGQNEYDDEINLSDSNYFKILNSETLNSNITTDSHFQTREISTHLHNYLNTYKLKKSIISKNPFRNRYNNNNDLFVHVRLTDVAAMNPGTRYYLNTFRKANFDKIYISTDDPSHDIIKSIIEYYPKAILIDYNEITTLQFASTCKNIVLSHGSFSALIGYLSFFSKIYYPEYLHDGNIDYSKNIWYGDMFRIEGWIESSI